MLTTSNYSRRCRTGGTSAIGISTSPGTLLTRPKLPLRSYFKQRGTYNYPHIENAPFGRPKRFRVRKLSSVQKMDVSKKKIPDYTETAYREAVSKLKYLLAESYTPRSGGKISREKGIFRRSNTRLHESGDDTDDRSAVSDCVSQPDKSRLPASILTAEDSQLTPRELTSFIMRQEQYIEQLEQESRYCKDELKNLLGKIREVVAENEALHDKNKTALLKAFLTEYEGCDDTKRDKPTSTDLELLSSPGKKMKLQKMDGPAIMYESRISELEAQLTQARIELKKAQEDRQSYSKKAPDSGGSSSPETVVQLEQAMREKRETNSKLDETLKNLQAARERETEASQKAKRAMDAAQQAEFEKAQAEAEIRRLKDELERQREKIREATQDACRRLAEERHQVERRYSHQVEQLSADVATHWDAASKSQMEIEKQRREIMDLKRELSQKQAMIDDLKKELQSKISSLQSDLNQMAAEKDAVEQELATAKLATERTERHARQEQNRLQTEINSYKQRIERADADIVHCRRENLRLSEQIASLEKELNMVKMVHAPETTPTPRKESDKELTTMIKDMESKHATQVGVLEDALSNQAKLVSRLTAECQSLTQRLDANNRTHKEEMASLQSNIEYLSSKIRETLESQKGRLSSTPESGTDSTKPQNPPPEDNRPQDPQYSAIGDSGYAQNYDGQQSKTQEMDPSAYQDNQSYQNYPTDYSNQDYAQYEQYDPALYQQSGQENQGQTGDNMYHDNQYQNYGNNEYLDNQQISHDQQYIDSSQAENVS